MKRTLFLLPTLFAALLLATVMLPVHAQQTQQSKQPPKHVAGKIVAVSHEKVNINNTWPDKVSVMVDNCDAPGTLKTVYYSPATVSDMAALGHLFDENIHSAETAIVPMQSNANGFGLFWLDANDNVLRTGILGDKMDCAAAKALLNQFP